MPTFQSDASSNTFTGSYSYANTTMTIPSGATVQEFAETDGSLVWIEPSGKFAIFWGASGWMIAADAAAAAPASMEPNDASVSGELRFWFNEDTIGNVPLGASGVSSWDNAITAEQFLDTGTPNIASGEFNSLDAVYFDGTNYCGDNNPAAESIDPFKGVNKPFTVIVVARPDAETTQCMWSMSNVADNTNSQLAFHLHSSQGMYILKRADTGGTNSQIYNFANKWTAGDLACFTFQSSDDGTELQFYRDKVEISDGASGLISNATNPPDAAIGVFFRPDSDNDFIGMICEVAVYSSGLQEVDARQIEQGLMTKWGIS